MGKFGNVLQIRQNGGLAGVYGDYRKLTKSPEDFSDRLYASPSRLSPKKIR